MLRSLFSVLQQFRGSTAGCYLGKCSPDTVSPQSVFTMECLALVRVRPSSAMNREVGSAMCRSSGRRHEMTLHGIALITLAFGVAAIILVGLAAGDLDTAP